MKKQHKKVNRDLSKILKTSTKERHQIDENAPLERFRCRIALRSAPGRSGSTLLLDCWSIFKILFGFLGPFSAPRENADRSKIVLLSIDGHFDPRKMPSGRGLRKKHENYMKNRFENRRCLMAQNHVWRYTLRLFYTFGFFETSRKIDAKRDATSCHFWSKNGILAPKRRLIQRPDKV